MNEILKFISEGVFSIVNVAAPSFQKVVYQPPAAYHARVGVDMKKAYDKVKDEAEYESSQASKSADRSTGDS